MTGIKVLNTLAEMYLILCTKVLHNVVNTVSRHLLYGGTSGMHGSSVILAHSSTQMVFSSFIRAMAVEFISYCFL